MIYKRALCRVVIPPPRTVFYSIGIEVLPSGNIIGNKFLIFDDIENALWGEKLGAS